MPDAQANVQIVISGTAVGLEEALAGAQQALSGFGAAADHASEQAGEHLARSEHEAGREAALLGDRARTAAEMVALLGAESSEQILRVEGLNSAFREAQHAFGGFGGAIAATAGSFALFKGLDFLHESVEEAASGEASWARLTAAYRGNAEELERVKATIEDTRATWEKLGITQGQVADMAARAAGMGLSPQKILGDPAAIADLAKALGTDIPGALDAISRPRGAQQVLSRLGLSPAQLRAATREMTYMGAQQRALFLEQQVERSRFAGQGLAAAGTAQGKFLAFHTAMADLREEVGTALLPALTQLATSLTSLLQGAEKAAQPFGGLATVLRTLFIPMIGAGLFLFTGLRGVMTRMVDLLLGRLVGAFAQTAESLAEADTEARDLGDDLLAIPELVRTVAVFDAAAAIGIKDAYKANIFSIPEVWTTRAIFEPAAIEETVPGALEVPIVAQNKLSAAEVTADAAAVEGATVKVPVVAADHLSSAVHREIASAQTYARRHPIIESIKTGLGTGLAFGAAFTVTDLLVNSKVTYVQDKSAKGTGSGIGHSVAVTNTPHVLLSGTPRVSVANLGTLGPALVSRLPAPATSSVLSATSSAAQPVQLVNVPTVRLDRTTPIGGTINLPSTLTVNAKQSGHWEVHLGKVDWVSMMASVAIGTALGSVFQAVGGKFADLLKNLLGGLIARFGLSRGEAAGLTQEVSAVEESPALAETPAQMAKRLLATQGKGEPIKPTETTTPSAEIPPEVGPITKFGSGVYVPNYFAMQPTYDKAHKITGWRPETPKEIAQHNAQLGQAMANFGKWVGQTLLGGIGSGIHAAFGKITGFGSSIIAWIGSGIKAGQTAIINAFIGIFNALLGFLRGIRLPLIGQPFRGLQNIPLAGSKSSSATGGGTPLHGYKALFENFPSGTGAAATRTSAAASAAAGGALTFTANFTINEAQNPQLVAREIERALMEFVRGVRNQRRLHG